MQKESSICTWLNQVRTLVWEEKGGGPRLLPAGNVEEWEETR